VPYRKDVLPNGIRVVSEAIPHVRSVAVGIWIETGSRMEPESRGGLSHLILSEADFVDHVDPLLTLTGLRLLFERNPAR